MTINVDFKNIIAWPIRSKMETLMLGFKIFCGFPIVHGAIDNTHFSISKPSKCA
jgi:hypothetical protein